MTEKSYVAEVQLKINNAPVEILGTISLNGQQSTQVIIKLKVKVNLPIFGALAEPQVVEKLKSVLRDEELLCSKWIAN